MNRSLRFLLVLFALAAAVVFGGAARADLPPSPLVTLNAPAGGAANLFMAIGMHTGDPGAGVFMGDFLSPNQSSKSWKISEILAVVSAKPGVLAVKPTATPVPARAGGIAPGLQLAPTPTPTKPSRP